VQRLAEERGYEIVEEVVAHMTSGADPERETRRRMFELADSGRLDGGAVLVHTMSRFSREQALFAIGDVGQLMRHEIVVLSALDTDLDPTSKAYPLLLAVKAMGTADEREKLIENTKRGIARAQEAGVWVGRVPWGLRRRGLVKHGAARTAEAAGLEQDPTTYPDLLRVFQLRADRWSLRRIARLVGKHETALLAVLRNKLYRPYVGDELWELAQSAAKTSRAFPGPEAAERRTYLYRGMLRCPHCGRMLVGRMVRHSQREGRNEYYVCKASHDEVRSPHPWRMVSSKAIDDRVFEVLDEADIVQPLAEEIEARLTPPRPEVLRQAERRRAELESERKRVLSQHRRGYIDDAELDEVMVRLRSDLDALPTEPDVVPEIAPTGEMLHRLSELIATTDRENAEEVGAANALLRRIVRLGVDRDREVAVELSPAVRRIVAAARAILDEAPTSSVQAIALTTNARDDSGTPKRRPDRRHATRSSTT
jgi:Site-specific recombinases, DNA invertase Pin homologs